MQIYEELQARGLIAQVTDEPQIRELVNNGDVEHCIYELRLDIDDDNE